MKNEKLWRTAVDQYIPMSVAAATTFHQVYGSTKAIVELADYHSALDIAATALSRLVPVYTLNSGQERIEVKVDLLRHRFEAGATRLHSLDGAVTQPLWVHRSGMLSAIALIKNSGLPFAFAMVPGAPKEVRLDETTPGG